MFRPAAVLAALLAASAGAQASITVTTMLTTDQEPQTPVPVIPTLANGQPRPLSFGTATFVINDAFNAMSFSATINNIDFTGSQTVDTNDNLLNAHIHAGPNTPPATNPVVWGFIGSPFNDNLVPNVVVTPFGGGAVGGTVTGVWDTLEGNNTTFLAQLDNILAGRAYINFHTVQFTGGEIRGAIPAVPEPETYALMLAGLAAVGWIGRRRNARRAA